MKKLLIGLLVIAAGAGAFFLLNKKKNTAETTSVNKELILGKWKPLSKEPEADTIQPMYQFDFQKNGLAMRSVSDTVKADSVYYEWNKAGELVVKEKVTDSAGVAYVVVKLTADSLQVQSKINKVNLLLAKSK
ncbi:MAG: hypothetical protein JNM19_00470 [Chitinophagaceae bacterium]|nr:hypothetical protein [Chitinophagaceae bacterium]